MDNHFKNHQREIIEKVPSPLALISGSWSQANILAEKLNKGNCEVVITDELPKSGKFDYLYLFGTVKDAYDAYLKLLKKNGRLLLIIRDGSQDIGRLKNLDNIKIVKMDDPEIWDGVELSNILLKISLTHSVNNYFNIKSRNSANSEPMKKKAGFKDNLKNLVRKKSEVQALSQVKVTRRISSPLLAFLIFFISAAVITTATCGWYIFTLRHIFGNLSDHLKQGSLTDVARDVSQAKEKIKIAKTMYKTSSIVLFPLKNFSFMTDLGQLIESTDRMLTVIGGTMSLAEELKAANHSYTLTGFTFSKSNFSKLVESVNGLDYAAQDLQEKIISSELPFIPKENLLPAISEARQNLTAVKELVPVLDHIFLVNESRTYLILFQNNMELRPTGGFIGSVGFLTVTSGRIEEFKIMDVYTLDGQLKGHVEPPEAIRLHLNQPNWFLRDSNFNPDFAETALQAEWFVQKILNQKIDGVIGVNLFFAQKLLETSGPVTLADFNNEIVTADNLFVKSQLHIQTDFFEGSTKKKDFLTALSQGLQNKIAGENISLIKLTQIIKNSLDEKNILIYLNDESSQQQIERMGWGGRIFQVSCQSRQKSCLADYLFLVDANLGVNKANYFIKKSALINKKINVNGQIITDLEINFENQGSAAYLAGGIYTNYLRLIVPKGSRLISASLAGKEIESTRIDSGDYQNDKTYYGMLIKIPELTKSQLSLSFLHSDQINPETGEYQFYFQKQPGDKAYSFNLSVVSSKMILAAKNFTSASKEGIVYASDTSVDRIFTFSVTH